MNFGSDPMITFESPKKERMPLVSVGIPTFDRPEGLRHALECITKQSYRNLEIIVSDNASPGNVTESVVHGFMATDLRIQYFRQPTNIGATRNFQFTLDKAQGEYFLWAADDDLCEPAFIDVLVTCMEDDASIALAMTDVEVIGGDDLQIRLEQLESIRIGRVHANWAAVRGLFFRYPTSNIFFAIYGVYRTNILRRCSLNMKSWRNLLFASEVPFLAQIATKGKIVSIPGPLKLYRSHTDSVYMKERSRVRQLDRLIRGAQIRLQLANIALSSNLRFQSKVGLLANNLWSWVKSMATLGYILLATIVRLFTRICRRCGNYT